MSIFALILAVFVSLANASDRHKCISQFLKYTSSPFEQKWIDNIDDWQRDVCSHISDDEMNWWIGNVSLLMNDTDLSVVESILEVPPAMPWSYIFSVFTYQRSCFYKDSDERSVSYVHIPIEPTAAIARDPRKVIFKNCAPFH
jgi:hypothetical protein